MRFDNAVIRSGIPCWPHLARRYWWCGVDDRSVGHKVLMDAEYQAARYE